MESNIKKSFDSDFSKYNVFYSYLISGMRDYTLLAIKILDSISTGQTNVESSLADKVYIKNSKESILSALEQLNSKMLISTGSDYLNNFKSGQYFVDLKLYVQLSEFLSDFSNTIVFRNYTATNGRVISVVNSKLNHSQIKSIKAIFKRYANILDCLYSGVYNKLCTKTENLEYYNTGYIKGVKINDVVKKHIGNKYVLSIDIGKFFNYILLRKMISQNSFGYIFDNSLFQNSGYDEIIEEHNLLKINELRELFIWLCNSTCLFLCYNGRLPTGSPYSPVLSNIFMIDFDLNIGKLIQEEFINNGFENNKYTITRYVDDFTISCNSDSADTSGLFDYSVSKPIEELLNSKGLYLKYEKTKCYNREKEAAPVLGYSLGRYLNKEVSTGAAYRTKLMNSIRPLKNSEVLDSSITSAINYYITNTNPYNTIDVLANIDVENKSAQFQNKFNGMAYKQFIYMAKEVSAGFKEPLEYEFEQPKKELKEKIIKLIDIMIGKHKGLNYFILLKGRNIIITFKSFRNRGTTSFEKMFNKHIGINGHVKMVLPIDMLNMIKEK